MCMSLKMLLSFVLLATAAVAQNLSVHQIWQWPQFTFIENLAVRQNGNILVTRLDKPYLQEVDPLSGQPPKMIYTFPDYMAVGGIVETEPELFAIIAGNFSLMQLKSYPGTYAMWSVDYRKKGNATQAPVQPIVSKVADIPEGGFLDGMTYSPDAKLAFIADAENGVILKMDVQTGDYSVMLNSTLTRKCHPTDLEAVNGIKYHDSQLYWTNTGCDVYAKVQIDNKGNAVGNATLITNTKQWIDDFAINSDGVAYAASSFSNQVVTIGPKGKIASVAGSLNSTLIAQPTAMVFGRSAADIKKGTLYVVTAGGIGDPINGTTIVGAQLLSIDTKPAKVSSRDWSGVSARWF